MYAFRTLTTADGLPHPSLYALAQDRFGYLWVATFGGIARFDGTGFTSWRVADGLPDANVRTLMEDRKGRLWVATASGAVRFERGPSGELLTDRRRLLNARSGLLSDFVQMLLPDRGDRLWVGTRDGGVTVLADLGDGPVVKRLRSGVELPAEHVWCGAIAEGDVWLGTRGGGVVRIRDDEIRTYGVADGLPHPEVYDLQVSAAGVPFAATSAGVARFDAASDRWVALPYAPDAATPTSSLAFDGSGNLWVGRYGLGIAKVTSRGTTVFREEQGLTSPMVTALRVDREGTLWIATQAGALSAFSSDRFAAYDRSTGWPGGAPTGLTEVAPGEVWAGSFGGGLLGFHGPQVQVAATTADGLPENRVRAFCRAPDGTLWAGTFVGLAYRRPGEKRFVTIRPADGLPDGSVSSLVATGAGNVWIGTARGLAHRRPDGRIEVLRKTDGLADDDVVSLAALPGGRLAIGTSDGLSLLAAGTLSTVPLDRMGLQKGRIIDLLGEPDGTLWVAGDSGLARFTPRSAGALPPAGRWTTFGVSDGLPRPDVWALVRDRAGVLWAGTGRGLARFDGTRFLRQDGLPFEDIGRGALAGSDGRIWWATSRGPVVYLPWNERPIQAPPPVYLEGVLAGGQPVTGASPLLLPSSANVVFRFLGLAYASSRVLYRTRLNGFDPGWSEPSTQREVRYTNLPPGSYRFEAEAANADGVWSAAPAAVDVVVPAPAWRRPWVLALALLGLGGLVYGGYEIRVAQLRRGTAQLEEAVRSRTRALREEAIRTRTLLSSMSDGVLFLEGTDVVRLANPAARTLLGGLPSGGRELPVALRTPEVSAALARALAERVSVSVRLTQRARTLQLHAAPVELQGVAGIVAVVSDVTELLELDRAKSEFIATVSHEIRTPLTSIRGALGLAASGKVGTVSPEVQQLLEVGKRNAERLSRLVNDLLDLERLELGALPMTLRRQPLAAIVERVAQEVEGLASASGVTVVVQNAARAALVEVDADRLAQTLVNLLSNAIKFSPAGETVRVSVGASGEAVRVAVTDRGPGVPAEFRHRIFGKFEQADGADARTRAGTGLGLSVSKAIVERLGGRIGFESPPGQGATFFLELPIVTADGAVTP